MDMAEKNIYIVTGTTRGFGRALAKVILAGKDFLLSLSSAADCIHRRHHNVRCDLSRPETIARSLERLLKTVDFSNAGVLILINNAGVLEPIGALDRIGQDRIVSHLLVNQAAPAILMAAFIRMTDGFHGKRRIINISSGAARHPYAGWAMYCASKAALNMMTRCAAAEQEPGDGGVAVFAVSPGKIETDMQVRIRASDPQDFPAREDFIQAWKHGKLLSADDAARMLLELDRNGHFKNGGIYDLREMDHRSVSS